MAVRDSMKSSLIYVIIRGDSLSKCANGVDSEHKHPNHVKMPADFEEVYAYKPQP